MSNASLRCIVCQVFIAFVFVLKAAAQDQREATPYTLNITIDRVVAHTSSAVAFSHGMLELHEGPHLILLRNLSLTNRNQSLEEKSLQVNLEGGGALVERIVWDDIPLATEEELKAFEHEIELIEGNRSRVQDKIQLANGYMTTLQKFGGNLVSPTPELVQKGESIVKILKDAYAAQLEVDDHTYSLKKQKIELDDKMQQLRANLRRSSQPQRAAKVYISVAKKAVVTFHLQQIVASVMWRPHYEIHVNSTSGLVSMMYHALVHQQTGHTWTNVSMELCTGAPSSDRRLPSLTPWFITSGSTAGQHEQYHERRMEDSRMNKRKIASHLHAKMAPHRGQGSATLASNEQDDSDEGEGDESTGRSFAQSEVISSGVSDVFVLPKRQTIPSSHDTRVHIATVNLKANLTYTAVPKKSTKVYVQASITNDSPFTLLPGSSLVFVDGSFVGSSNVNLIPINGQAFLDVGIDNAISVIKKVVSAETKSTGGAMIWRTKTTEFQYEVVLKSMRSFGLTVRVQDQVPLPQSEDLKVVVTKPAIGELRADHDKAQIDKNISLRTGGEIVWELYLYPDTVLSIPLEYTIEVAAGRYIRNVDIRNFEL
eukprot:gnl/MRDRNA2_/MRDRNA2_26170_c0_seq1.p1 gnl/MRDRNA2_/MRDRNA2_26170_c0~~gnl/MRDRNA2_/MRDRNA2_26170_c0_seq1.p1  ORF type:complete len:635 (+),score=88.10 gnl/MRDRNA2_/MRDRNA2_26170_c0_seq1:116-1906(+)